METSEVKIADYIQRMIDERKELNEKIVKLVAFRFSEKGEDSLDDTQRMLLDDQFFQMKQYSDTLRKRIRIEKIKTGVIPDPDSVLGMAYSQKMHY